MTPPEMTERDLLIKMSTQLDQVVHQVTDHETRVRSLEQAKWILAGAAAVIGGVAGRLVGLL